MTKLITGSNHGKYEREIITLSLPTASHSDADNAEDLSLDVGMVLRERGVVRQRRERPQKVRQIRLYRKQSIDHLLIISRNHTTKLMHRHT